MVHFFCCWELIGVTSNTANLKVDSAKAQLISFLQQYCK
jgi:hypothetical protein